MGAGQFEFQNTDRFRVLRRIGEGGMGVVYEAFDAERGQHVALKALRHPDADQIYRLKREFRALADLSDPHLVDLYELFVDENLCYFTMELVTGVPFLEYCSLGQIRAPDMAKGSDAGSFE